MSLLRVVYVLTLCALTSANNADIKVVIEKITAELGSGRLTVSSYLHHTAEYCLERLDKSLTVGQESLHCYTNAYSKTFEKNQNTTVKLEKQLYSEKDNWELLCKVWPLLSSCHRKTTVPATDQCYEQLFSKANEDDNDKQNLSLEGVSESENGKRGSNALSFTDSYISFQCMDINRTVEVLELARPRRLICFEVLKDHISNCAKKAVDDSGYTEFSLKRTLLLIHTCFETEYTKYSQYCSRINNNAGKVIPFLKDMFDYINKDMFGLELANDKPDHIRNSSVAAMRLVNDKQMKETKKNIDSKIKDVHLKNFLTNIILPENIEQNSDNVTDEIASTDKRLYLNDHIVYPAHRDTGNKNNPNHDSTKNDSNDAKRDNSQFGILIVNMFLMIYV